MDIFGTRVKQLLQQKGMTQEELALLIDTTPPTLSRYINNHRSPTSDILKKISFVFNISADYLIGNNENYNFDNTIEIYKKLISCDLINPSKNINIQIDKLIQFLINNKDLLNIINNELTGDEKK